MRFLLAALFALISTACSAQLTLTHAGRQVLYTGVGDVATANGVSSSMTAYWGLRCYSAAYTGNVADVWDSATGTTTETVLTCSAGNAINQTVNPLATTCASGCVIKTFYDQTGNSNNLSTPSNILANMATLNTSCSGLSGKYNYCAVFNGSSDYYKVTIAGLATAQPYTYAAVSERTGAFTSLQIMMATSTSGVPPYLSYRAVANNVTITAGTGVNVTGINDSAFHASVVTFNGASSCYYIGSASAATTSLGTSAQTTSIAVGASTTPGNYMTGSLVEAFVASPSSLCAAAPAIQANQNAYWGIN